jgi:hypothetical protein
MADDVRLVFVYGWRWDVGPFYLSNARTVDDDGIRITGDMLNDRRGFTRTKSRASARAKRSGRVRQPAAVNGLLLLAAVPLQPLLQRAAAVRGHADALTGRGAVRGNVIGRRHPQRDLAGGFPVLQRRSARTVSA